MKEQNFSRNLNNSVTIGKIKNRLCNKFLANKQIFSTKENNDCLVFQIDSLTNKKINETKRKRNLNFGETKFFKPVEELKTWEVLIEKLRTMA